MKNLFEHHFAKLCVVALIVGGGSFLVAEQWFGSDMMSSFAASLADVTSTDSSDGNNNDESAPADDSSTLKLDEPASKLVAITVNGLKPVASQVCFAVFKSDVGFPKTDNSQQAEVIASDGPTLNAALMLPVNEPIAISIYQDIDGNGELTRDSFGIPNEPYGFSNDARGMLGPPTFQDSTIQISAETRELTVTLK